MNIDEETELIIEIEKDLCPHHNVRGAVTANETRDAQYRCVACDFQGPMRDGLWGSRTILGSAAKC